MKFLLGVLAFVSLGSALVRAESATGGRQASGTADAPAKMQWIEHEFLMPVQGAPQGIDVLQV